MDCGGGEVMYSRKEIGWRVSTRHGPAPAPSKRPALPAPRPPLWAAQPVSVPAARRQPTPASPDLVEQAAPDGPMQAKR